MSRVSAAEFKRDPLAAVHSTKLADLPQDAVKDELVINAEFRAHWFETLAHDFGKSGRLEDLGPWLPVLVGLHPIHRELFLALARSRHVLEWRDEFARLFGDEYSEAVRNAMPGYFDPETDDDELF